MSTESIVKSSLACGLQACLSQKWTSDDFMDVTIVVEDLEFRCHKFILSACSSFLDKAFHAEMIESIEGRVVLSDMTKDTLTIIVNSIYTGEDGLTAENVIQVWHATHFLDIPYLVEECENFVMKNMTLLNYEDFYAHAKVLNSVKVVDFAKIFMLKNFDNFRKSETFFNLSFDEVRRMVDDPRLKAKPEDSVIEAIFAWINHNKESMCASRSDESSSEVTSTEGISCDNDSDNDEDIVNCEQKDDESDNDMLKTGETSLTETLQDVSPEEKVGPTLEKESKAPDLEQFQIDTKAKTNSTENTTENCVLIGLLKAARVCLASRGYLEKLMRNPMITSDPDALSIVHESLLYQWKAECYSENNIVRYRDCYELCSVMLYLDVETYKFRAYSLQENNFRTISIPNRSTYKKPKAIAVVNGDIYTVTSETEAPNSQNNYHEHYLRFYMCKQDSRSLEYLGKMKSAFHGVLLAFQNEVFYCSNRNEVINFETNCVHSLKALNITDCYYTPCGSTVFNGYFVTFHPAYEFIIMNRYNKRTGKARAYKQIKGPSENLTSFQHDRNLFVLLKDGSLWMLPGSDPANDGFTYLAKLWDGEKALKGAVCYADQLIVFCDDTRVTTTGGDDAARGALSRESLPGVFHGIRFEYVHSGFNLVPMVIAKRQLKWY